MPAPIRSMIHIGSSGIVVEAECHISNGLPGIVVVGLGNKAIDEARERVRSAFASSSLPMPRKRITINLAPADIPKDSTSLDLAIAIAILHADGLVPETAIAGCAFIGELSLDGGIRGVRGIIGKLLAGKRQGITTFFIPKRNLPQALLVPGITAYAAETLAELCAALVGSKQLSPYDSNDAEQPAGTDPAYYWPFDDIAGQARAKRALIIAAAGGHNILLSGPPGTGKSMLAKAMPSLLPPLNRDEMLEITHLHSLASTDYEQLLTTRPFRAPHHSTSYVAMVGGGTRLRPGEISLSHHGILFLDELPEFSRQTIEALRQPLENGAITVTRARDSAEYPANFMLVATANPCPCGYYGTGSASACECPASRILAYRQKISGPILDRIDLYIDVDVVQHSQLLATQSSMTSAVSTQTSIQCARERQKARYGNATRLNRDMSNADIRRHAALQPKAVDLLNAAATRLSLSARSYMRTIKVSRTVADLENSDTITVSHITEALQYRPPARTPLA